SELVQPLLTDLYQFTMAYSYWKNGKHREKAVFEVFFRENPFGGEFALFCGLQDCLLFLERFAFTQEDLQYLESVLPNTVEREFFDYLGSVDASKVILRSAPEGSVVFARVPLLEVEGPLLVVQLMETTLLCLVNYARAAKSINLKKRKRFQLAAESCAPFVFWNLRGQGNWGSGGRANFVPGFDGTSNVLAAKLYGIPVAGTVGHSYITSFSSLAEVQPRTLRPACEGKPAVDFVSLCLAWLSRVCRFLRTPEDQVNRSEFAAFIAYAISFPRNFLVLVDTYSVARYSTAIFLCSKGRAHHRSRLSHCVSCWPINVLPAFPMMNAINLSGLPVSGVPNFCSVALALGELQYQAAGVRLDSGDLSSQSVWIRRTFQACADEFHVPWFHHLSIAISDNISEQKLLEINQKENEISLVGVGTNLVTCTLQPSLGCVYKLVEANGKPRIKLSEDQGKTTLPGRKCIYRLYDGLGVALLDLITLKEEPSPVAGQQVACQLLRGHVEPLNVTAAWVETLHQDYFREGRISQPLPSIATIRTRAATSLNKLGLQHKRLQNPEPYKVAMTSALSLLLNDLIKADRGSEG
uniref:nicotinate phosphoribosyltransferase n=1 Tax=Latimeria chalumnae TaxID=7897 RepID=H3A8S5_LATCH